MLNVRFTQGDSKVLRVTVRDAAGALVPLDDMTACRYRAAKTYVATPVIDKALGSGIAAGAEPSTLDVTFQPADTQALRGDFRHELEVTRTGAGTQTAFHGWLTLDPALIGA